MADRVMPVGYKLAPVEGFVIEMPWNSIVGIEHPDYQAWLAEGNHPAPADLLPPPPPDWVGLYTDLVDPARLLPLFQRIKAVAKQSLSVNAAFTTLIPTIATTKLEPALASAIEELATDLENAGQPLTQEERSLWNIATEARGFSAMVRL